MGDIVRYHIKFKYAIEPVPITRKDLLKWRPRGYVRWLKEVYSRVSHLVDKVSMVRTIDGHREYYCKFHKYPEEDSKWVKEDDIQTGVMKLRDNHIRGTLENTPMLGCVTLKPGAYGPNRDLFKRD